MIRENGKRILVFNDGLELGGTEKLLVDLLVHLVKKECVVTLLLPEKNKNNVLLPEIPKAVRVTYIFQERESRAKRKWSEIQMVFFTNFFLKKHAIQETNYDQVICFKEGFYAKIFSKFQIPKILWIHNVLYKRKYEIASLKERVSVCLNKVQISKVQKSYTFYNTVVCVSQASKDAFLNVVYKDEITDQDIRIIPNAIDVDTIRRLAEDKISFSMSPDKTNFILLTRLSPDKRIDRILKATKQLQDSGYKSFHVYILGVDVDDKVLNDELKNQNIQSLITLCGKVSNPYPYIKQADWLICVSERESFSLALLEGMSLGVPVITTDCGGPANIIENGKYGFLTENSTSGVYKGMKAILEDGSLEDKYSENLDIVLDAYKQDRWLDAIEDLLLSK